MAQLVFKNNTSLPLQNRMTTVRSEDSSATIDFTVLREGAASYQLIPGSTTKIRVNGQALGRASALRHCDRIEWSSGGAAVFIENDLPATQGLASADPMSSLRVLQEIAALLQSPAGLESALQRTLSALVERAGAEAGHLVAELGADGTGWELLASRHEHSEAPTRQAILSDTILQEAVRTRAPVHISNIVGHAWSGAESVIQARIFSAACFPLVVGDRVFGAAFLLTRTPGRSIRAETLPELHLFATQAALLLASQIEISRARRENRKLRGLISEWPSGLVFESAAMADVARKIEKLSPTPLSVLILGETGSGKEVVARELHERSPRAAKGPLVAVNCAAIPATLLESTLFGHERGAFTGAVKSQAGKFLQAHGGTLFLDEIGDLPLELQAKLLRALQERQIEPIGAARPIPVDIRVIAATHQDLDQAVRAGRFRQDLYFRLAGATLRLPPLRERKADIAPLARHFLEKTGSELDLTPEAWTVLENHAWPGNVRELEQVITRAALLAEGSAITAQDLELRADGAAAHRTLGAALVEQASELKLKDAQEAFTAQFVAQVLDRNQGNRTAAAAELGISERTLYRILAAAPGATAGLPRPS